MGFTKTLLIVSDIQCEAHEFKCLNNKCINKNLRCNGVDDCGENDAEQNDSDEENCLGTVRSILIKRTFIRYSLMLLCSMRI